MPLQTATSATATQNKTNVHQPIYQCILNASIPRLAIACIKHMHARQTHQITSTRMGAHLCKYCVHYGRTLFQFNRLVLLVLLLPPSSSSCPQTICHRSSDATAASASALGPPPLAGEALPGKKVHEPFLLCQ